VLNLRNGKFGVLPKGFLCMKNSIFYSFFYDAPFGSNVSLQDGLYIHVTTSRNRRIDNISGITLQRNFFSFSVPTRFFHDVMFETSEVI
jgi:hypothetical protein